ncbi:MAG TPA: xanthine dehydrogenase molybdopterin binding subunit [Phycisphaerae bacterium]|nr:xanthine dehydrogenase molybdopterin binding subunit [Phycisphaerae bacterium]
MTVVGKNIPHESAATHVAGRSTFIDDVPPRSDEVFLEIFGSPVAHGRLKSLDLDAARAVKGAVGIFTAKDVPGHNHFGPIIQDEHLLAAEETTFVGDPLVLIAAATREAAVRARLLVRAEMEPLPAIFSVDQAIAAGSFIGPERVIETGNVKAALAAAEHTLTGTLDINGQEHFYLESQAAIAYPGEGGEMLVLSSTQHPTEVQSIVAEVLGVPFNHVTVQCRRMGGGFGGKETQAAGPAAMAALVAAKLKRPARIVLDRDTDMALTGKRHPFTAFYTVGFSSTGRISALQLDLFSNGGCTADLSPSVLERAMLHSDNAYFLPNARITGRVCKTNLPSNTAFRGFGGPQGVAAKENILEEIAIFLKRDALDIRLANLYGIGERDITPYGQKVENNVLPQLISDLRDSAAYDRRRSEINAFNAQSTSHLRGLALTPVKFGISFTKKTLNQANALVNVYTDGSALVTTGATEMGQGVYTRIRQLVADDLGIPYERVRIGPTATDKNCNTSPTAASSGTDLNGAAALDATGRIKSRLAAFAAPLLNASAENLRFADDFVFDPAALDKRIAFLDLVCRAYLERIDLGERGFYITPGVDFDRDTGKGTPFLYYTNGAAVAEVLIDRFTGELAVPRVDLLMDAGIPLNPGIDRGQIIGGFIQGMGWVTTEEVVFDAKGVLLSHSPTTYKIPNISDVPEIFNVRFFNNPDSAKSLKRSKALGEPPLLLSIAVWAAVKNALAYAAAGAIPPLSLPATGEQILMRLSHLRQTAARRAIPESAPAR